MTENIQAAAAREAARNPINGQFGEQPLDDPGAGVLGAGAAPLRVVVDDDDEPVNPCMVEVVLFYSNGEYTQAASWTDFDAAPVLASMSFADRVHYATCDPEHLYTLACTQHLIEGFPGDMQVLNVAQVADWVDQNPQLKLIGIEGWSEVWDADDNAIVVQWNGGDQRASEAAAVRVEQHVQQFLSEGRHAAVSETPDDTMRIMPCLSRAEAVTIAAVNGYDQSATRDGYTEFWCYTAPDDGDDFDYDNCGQADGVIRIYEPEERF